MAYPRLSGALSARMAILSDMVRISSEASRTPPRPMASVWIGFRAGSLPGEHGALTVAARYEVVRRCLMATFQKRLVVSCGVGDAI